MSAESVDKYSAGRTTSTPIREHIQVLGVQGVAREGGRERIQVLGVQGAAREGGGVCGQVFSRSDHLHTHQRTHTGTRGAGCRPGGREGESVARCSPGRITSTPTREHTQVLGVQGAAREGGRGSLWPGVLQVGPPPHPPENTYRY